MTMFKRARPITQPWYAPRSNPEDNALDEDLRERMNQFLKTAPMPTAPPKIQMSFVPEQVCHRTLADGTVVLSWHWSVPWGKIYREEMLPEGFTADKIPKLINQIRGWGPRLMSGERLHDLMMEDAL